MKALEAVVFDLDGTLVRSRHDYREMLRRVEVVLSEAGVPDEVLSEPGKVRQIIRSSEEDLEDLGLTGAERKRTHRMITEALNDVELLALESLKPMTGARETLHAIKERGLKVGIATRAGTAYASRCLKITGLIDYVDVFLARDEVEHPKPDPRHLLQVVDNLGTSPQRVVYIGDTTTDLTTAIAADIHFIGYAGNEEWVKRMKESGWDTFISDLGEVVEMIDGKLNPSLGSA